MPEIQERDPADFIRAFEQFLKDAPEDLTLDEIDNLQIVLYCRLRSIMTSQQLHQRAHILIQQAEVALTTPGVFVDENGVPSQPILVENFQGNAEEYQAMMKQTNTEISDEEIAALFKEEE